MIHGLCTSYHWSYEEAMSRTLPQIIMLNHAAWVEHEDMERRIAAERDGESFVVNGKKVSAEQVASDDDLREAQMNDAMSFFMRV